MHTLTTKYPDLPDGEELTMAGLPVTLVNGKGVEVDEEATTAFEVHAGQSLSDSLKGNPYIKLTKKAGGDK